MKLKQPIYLDYHATTPVDPRVLQRMLPFFTEHFGNPASHGHRHGWQAAAAVEEARRQVARLLTAKPSEIVLTSGATEAINLAIQGVARATTGKRDTMITVVTEHKAVLESIEAFERGGGRVIRLGVDRFGRLRLEELERALDERTLLVSVMLANNEIGTLQPISEIGALCQRAGVLFHCDATQGVGWQSIDVNMMGIDLASISAHKLYGPKGAGALFVRRQKPAMALKPVLFGGDQERGLRPGTVNVPGVVGLGEACRIAIEEQPIAAARMRKLRDRLHQIIEQSLPGVLLNGCPLNRHPGNLNLTIEGVGSDELLGMLPDISFSAGSACTSATSQPSHVLAAIGRSLRLAESSIRFGIGRFTTDEEIELAGHRFVEVATSLRQRSRIAS